ncbi:MAG TPA: PaaI family thioesterase [Gemmatimonadales bacterium]
MSDPRRERTIRWDDPALIPAAARRMPGLELIRAMERGEVPAPIAVTMLGIGFDLIEPGHVIMHLDPDETHYNAIGSVHGGVLTTLLDTAIGLSIHATLPLGRSYTTLDIAVRFIKAVRIDQGRMLADATVIHSGRSTAIGRATVRNAAGVLYATAESTCLLFDTPAARGT